MKSTKMDPETVDLMWELHADLGSNRPVHIISGYRSPKTNAFLKRIGRNVAQKEPAYDRQGDRPLFPGRADGEDPQ